MSDPLSLVDSIRTVLDSSLEIAESMSAALDSYTPGGAYSRIPTTFSTGRAFGTESVSYTHLTLPTILLV